MLAFVTRNLYLQEQVAECRELNSTEQWLAVAAAVNPLAQSMPLLLHHQVRLLAWPLGVLQLSSAFAVLQSVMSRKSTALAQVSTGNSDRIGLRC